MHCSASIDIRHILYSFAEKQQGNKHQKRFILRDTPLFIPAYEYYYNMLCSVDG